MVASTGVKTGARRVLRIVSRCSSVEEFISVFHRFCDQSSLFIATKTPKPVGSDSRFNITLADGKPMLVGAGKVVESHTDQNNAFGRPGMKIRFSDLDDSSRAVLDQLNQARSVSVPTAPPPPLPRHLRRPGTAQPVPPRSAELAAQAESAAEEESANVAAAVAPPAEQRRQGSDFILPANPFGELTDASLEAFVECTLYEETSNISIDNDPAATGERSSDIPAWWPSEESATGEPHGLAPPDGAPAGVAGTAGTGPASIITPRPQGRREDLTPSPGAAPLWAPTDNPSGAMANPASAGVLQPVGALQPFGTTVGHKRRVPPFVLATAIALPLGLLIGFLIWGGGGDRPAQKPVPSEPAAVARSQPLGDAAPAAASAHGDAGVGAALAATADAATTPPTEDSDPGDEITPPDQPPDLPTGLAPDADQCAIAVDITGTDGGTVFADGHKLGTTPFRGLADCDTKQVVVHRPRYESVSRAVTLVPGDTTEVSLHMRRPTFELQISSSPAKATAYVGGRSVGLTPVKVSVQGFVTTTVKVAKKGYAAASQRIYPKKNPTRISVSLKSTAKPRSRSKTTR